MNCGLVVLAGGFGTRLRSVLGDVPKVLAPVGGRPVLEHHARLARRYALTDVVALTGVGAEQIDTVCGTGAQWGIPVRCIREPEPIGTAGALLAALPELGERFVVSYGDAMMDVALDRFVAHHVAHGAAATMLLHPNDHPHDSDLVDLDAAGRVRAVHGYPHPAGAEYANLVNAALYVFERAALEPYRDVMRGRDIAKHLVPRMLADGVSVSGYRSREYIKDLGTPERLARVNRDFESGLIAQRNAEVAAPAVFFDRDGTLNEKVGHLARREQLTLLPGAGTAVRRVNRAGLLAVVLTNQPVIARGECSEEELAAIHGRLDALLGAERAYLDAVYFCAHHPERGFAGERPELKIACDCRKPAIGLALQAVRRLNIDVAQSWMIGDSTVDIEFAARAGLRSVLVQTGNAGRDGRFPRIPDYEFADVDEATAFITDHYPPMLARAREIARDILPGAIVALGGLARAGKSTWASVLRQALAERGVAAHRVGLDGWLLPPESRGPGVRGRYDYDGVARLVAEVTDARCRGEAVRLTVRGYDRLACTPVALPGAAAERVVAPSDVVIVEGVPALDLPALAEAPVRCFVALPEAQRRERFECDYRRRGETPDRIAALWAEREVDERALIVASQGNATHVLEGAFHVGVSAL